MEGLLALLLRQLPDDTLVATVDTLCLLPLLYLVNADVDVAALDIELRQLFEYIELALEAVCPAPLFTLVGDAARGAFV